MIGMLTGVADNCQGLGKVRAVEGAAIRRFLQARIPERPVR